MVDVGGYRLHVNPSGEGRPTVILDAGMISFSSNWAWVQPEVARVTRVIAYDRAGLGWSDPGPKPRDVGQKAAELQTALHKLGIEGPYVLVGHSYGGLVMRAFATAHPDAARGMVLVDASHPDQWARFPAARGGRTVALANRVVGWLAQIGFTFPADREVSRLAKGLPQPQADQIMSLASLPRAFFTTAQALAAWDGISRPLVRSAKKLGALPLVVLGVTEQPGFAGERLTGLQRDLAHLSSDSIYRVVQGATHENLVSSRANAQVVAGYILRVVEAVRSAQPLTS
jgi:pimeloyl-ACP methyl ester carboxylesterase